MQNIVTSQSKACSMGDSMPTLYYQSPVFLKPGSVGSQVGTVVRESPVMSSPFIVKMKMWQWTLGPSGQV